MSKIYIDFITNHPRNDIAFVDITVMHQSDSTKNQHIINQDIQDGDLTRGVRVASFIGLQDNVDYKIVLYALGRTGHLIGRGRTQSLRTRGPTYSGWWPFRRVTEFSTVISISVT